MIQVEEVGLSKRIAPSPRLAVLGSLFERLHAEGILYCHWKSNEHLAPSLCGTTDLDILVHRKAALPLARILSEMNFKRFVVKAGRGYPGVEDYLGFDNDAGKLTHLHIHYQLTLGEKFLKGHRLPWEDVMLSTRSLDEEHQIYVPDANLELLVLVIRTAMKLRTRDFFLAGGGQPYFRGSALREFRWLVERVEKKRLLDIARQLVGARAAEVVLEMTSGAPPTIRHFVALRRHANPSFDEYRMYSSVGALCRRWYREVVTLSGIARKRLLGVKGWSTRTPPQGGLLIAFVGADGAGKSSVAKEISRWLAREAAVVSIYGGSGDGSASLPRRALQLVASLHRRMKRARPTTEERAAEGVMELAPTRSSENRRERMGMKTVGRLLWALSLARERRMRALHGRRARSLGMIVLSDRVPQSQFPGLNDGPRLAHWLSNRSRVLRAAAERERAAYRSAELCPPDVVVKLLVTPDVALLRKPTTPVEQLRKKVEIVRKLEYPLTTRVVEIDSNQPFDQVLLRVKEIVWESI